MSRCFPFPPPGYERKHRPEEIDLFKEARRKEKKHRKDRKDWDRSKDKEKGEKDGSDEKHKEKKDRKGKHKDKKEKHRDYKDKEDRGKDKEKSSISEESTVAGKLGENGQESFRPKGECKDRSSVVDEGKDSAPFPGQNCGRPIQNSQPFLENMEDKFLQELDRRTRADETSRASQLPDGLAGLDRRGQEAAASRSAARNSSGTLAEEKMGYNKGKRVATMKMDAQEFRNEVVGNSTVQNFTVGKSRVDVIPRPEEKHVDRKWEDNEKSKEIGDNKHRDKLKEEDNKYVEKEKDRRKKKEEKKNKGKVQVESKSKRTEEEIPRDLASNDLLGVTSNNGTDFFKNVKKVITDGNIKKRKDMDTNGFFLENKTRPLKMPKLTPHQSTENGRKLEAHRTTITSASNKHVVPNSVRLDKGDKLINGMIQAQKSLSSKPITPLSTGMIEAQKPLSLKPITSSSTGMIGSQKSFSSKPITSSTIIVDQHTEGSKVFLHNSSNSNRAPPEPIMEDPIAEAARRPPHPDSKYLNEVFTVPKLGDWSGNDDQDWLFSKQPPSTMKKSGSVLVKEQCVWSEAVFIESADICVMPYVIPY